MMKKFLALLAAGLMAGAVSADTYLDATGDLDSGAPDDFSGFTHLDISQVDVTSDGINISFIISVVQNPITAPNDWGNYMVGIDTTAGGDSVGNGWSRPISMTGMDYWLGAWVNGGGDDGQAWNYNGASWSGPSALTVSTNANTVTMTTTLASLGLVGGETIKFDVYTSGSGATDGAVDALSSATPSITTWGAPGNAYDTAGNGLSYQVVPEPGTIALMGLFGVIAGVRYLRRKQ